AALALSIADAQGQGWGGGGPWAKPASPPIPRGPIYRPPSDDLPPGPPPGGQASPPGQYPPAPGPGSPPGAGPAPSARPGPGQNQNYGQRSNICVQLERRLVAETQGSNQSRDLLPRIENDMRQLERNFEQAQQQLNRADCWDQFLFSKTLRRTPRCVQLA